MDGSQSTRRIQTAPRAELQDSLADERHAFEGVLLGRYKVERVLGEGGMSVVLGVRHKETGALFAMKVLKRSLAKDPSNKERFFFEARLVARLRSEHVVRIFDVGELPDGTPYLLMEYLEGTDLRHVLETRAPLSVPEAIDWMQHVVEALTEAHALGIVHRDLKPENLFVTVNRDFTTSVKVLDFGISVDETSQNAALTWVGAPDYTAPEELRHIGPSDVRSDLWSLGVIFYELLLHERPASSAQSIREKRPDVPRELDALILGCLSTNAEGRASAAALASCLRQLRDRLVWRRRSRAPHPSRSASHLRPEERLKLRPRQPRRGFRRAANLVAMPDLTPTPPPQTALPKPAPSTTQRGSRSIRLAIAVGVCAVLLACGAAGLSATHSIVSPTLRSLDATAAHR